MKTKEAFLLFKDFLETRRQTYVPGRDIREHVLSLTKQKVGFSYLRKALESRFGANLPNLFEHIVASDEDGLENCSAYFAQGTVQSDPKATNKSTTQFFNLVPDTNNILLIETGFLATSHSWIHSAKGDPSHACLGYVYDDIAHYFMADYPNRLIEKLNSAEVPSGAELTRAEALLQRIVGRRISKYNAQPMNAPAMTEGFSRRVLVCDQAYGDASTFYGKVGDVEFEQMLSAAIAENPDAEILVKTHPDTVWGKGMRTGYYAHLQTKGRVRILREPVNPYTLFDLVDTVYVGTSQMGLEALFAGKKVVTFGVPFYAGWGLTDDRQKIPHRHRDRTLAEVFHYFYIWYTIYHLPDRKGPAEIEDVLSFIELNRPFALPPTSAEIAAQPKVSVIIPVHGVEKYIEECINSVQVQSLREIEIIPINDASPDGSQEIIDRLAAQDPRIKPIVLTDNIGQGFARNLGLKKAEGDYIWFLDSDDWLVDSGFLEETVKAADENHADMTRAKKAGEAIFDENDTFLKVVEDRTEQHFTSDVPNTNYIDCPDILHSRHFCLWLYRKSFLEKNDIEFVTTQWEERAFLLKALLRADAITLTTNQCFMYRIRPTSTARRAKGMLDIERMLENFEQICLLLHSHGGDRLDSSLRPHVKFQISQFLHILFFGFWHQTLVQEGENPDPYYERLAKALSDVNFCVEDLTDAPDVIRKDLFGKGCYHLIVSALRTRMFEWIDVAVNQRAIPQSQLYDELLSKPQSDATRGFQMALSQYARNDLVFTDPMPVKSRVPNTAHQKPRIIVHIGSTKTGSTYLQHLLDKNRPALLREGVWVPEVGLFWQPTRPRKQAGHSNFFIAVLENNNALLDHIERGLAFMNGKIHTIVLSSEAFFLKQEKQDSQTMKDYFDGYPMEVIAYIRRQDEWANSQYCEFVAGGAISRVDVPIAEWLEDPNTRRWMDYRIPLKAWSDTIGSENVTVRIFDKSEFVGGNLLEDFSHAANLPQLLDLPKPEEKEQNEARLTSGHVELTRLFNTRKFATLDDYFSFIEEIGDALTKWRRARELPQPKPWMLSEEQADELMVFYAEANAEIASEYFGRKDAPLFSERGVSQETPPIFPEEIELFEDVYQRYAPAPSPEVLVNYGLFGWRLRILTPILALLYARITTPMRLSEFRADPEAYSKQHWAERRPIVGRLLYPQGNLMGPASIFKLWLPIARRIVAAMGREDMLSAFEADPILFARRLRSPLRRLIGRLMFPLGEVRIPKD